MIVVRFYAGLRDLARTASLELRWSTGTTVASLRNSLSQQLPATAPLLARSSLAVNDQLVTDEALIPDNAEVALLPPVSGG